jgi:hypothetical protein
MNAELPEAPGPVAAILRRMLAEIGERAWALRAEEIAELNRLAEALDSPGRLAGADVARLDALHRSACGRA